MPVNNLRGATALVTGADTPLGEAIALALHAAGVRLAIHVLNAQPDDLEAELCVRADPRDSVEVASAMEWVAEEFGELNLLVTCHAQPLACALAEQDEASFWSHVDAQLGGTFAFVQSAEPLLKKAGWGRVVLLTSAWGVGARDLAAVAAASGGVQVLCKSLARELGSHGVTVNAIAHAFTDSDWLALDARALDIGENVLRTAPQAYVPAAALGQPAQVAHSVLLLCHPVLGAATGQTLQCNGGYFRHRT